jgi:hypothetical protein
MEYLHISHIELLGDSPMAFWMFGALLPNIL